ncbi:MULTISPECIES: non-homologous end joining protein Ku [Streptomyces]|uniref:non-homologous end joining protein Ku n=1 Tax=Streptomyces TaxID=1883 RepID=UPI0004746C33|nr:MULTISPECIES: Ku protein [Streptomyces]MCK1813415.1 Ku protein [Streptomyces sp. XM4011]QKV71937.1 Ku protein [Streptomyces harbinensis]
MRSLWKGTISFGLVSIPVKVVSATENHSVSFRQVHTADDGRVRYRKVCELDGEELSGDEIGKAYETADGSVVQLSDDDLAALPLPTARTVDILGFVPVSSIDPYQLDRSYYLAPDSGAIKPYALLREALRRSEKGAIAKLAMRGRETLALLRALEGDSEAVLGMHTLLWPDEIRPATGVVPSEKVTVRDAELDLADTLMDTLGSVDMADLHDEYRAAVEALVTAKVEGRAPEEITERPATGGRVIDLMSALEDSVRTARQARGEGGGEGEEATVTPIGKKPAAGKKKAPAKKSAGKKTAAKKTAAGKDTTKKKAAAKKTASRKRAS